MVGHRAQDVRIRENSGTDNSREVAPGRNDRFATGSSSYMRNLISKLKKKTGTNLCISQRRKLGNRRLVYIWGGLHHTILRHIL